MRPGYRISHHANNDKLIMKERQLTKQAGYVVLCSLTEVTKCCKPHL
jgi:hypothetical protein